MIASILGVYIVVASAVVHREETGLRTYASKNELLQRLRAAERIGDDLAQMAKKSADDIEELLPMMRKRNVNPEHIRKLEKSLQQLREMAKRK